ncbi:hypothetical protein TYRP_015618 [Tyrophagus putrescentiae]|nr:hypothetical protein TYRP_015618 [Tyrophagus putrescentiae]
MFKLNKIARLEFAEAENGGVRSVLKRGYRLRWRKFPTSPVVSWLCLLTAVLLLLTLVAGSGYLLHRYRSALKMAMVVGDAASAAANVAGKAKAAVVGAAVMIVPSTETLQGLKVKTVEKVDKVGGALKKKWNSLRLKKETMESSTTSTTEVAPRTAEPEPVATSTTSSPVTTSTMATSMISTTTTTTTTTTMSPMKAPSPATSKRKSKPPTYPFLMPFFRINSNFPWIWNL